MADKVFSRLLNQEVETNKRGSKHIIQHKELEKIAMEHSEIAYQMDVIASKLDHAVVTCTITSGDVKMTTIGECTPDTMWSKGERDYPTTVAWNRAFDRAMIKILDFSEIVFSNKEIKPEEKKTERKVTPVANETAPQRSVNSTNDAQQDADLSMFCEMYMAPNEENTEILEVKETIPSEKAQVKNSLNEKHSKVEPHQHLEEVKEIVSRDPSDNDILLFSKWKGKKIKDVCELHDFKKFTDWTIRENITFKEPEKQKQLDYIRKRA